MLSSGGKTTAACPVCRASGRDKKGSHLAIWANGNVNCVVGCDWREIKSILEPNWKGSNREFTHAEKMEYAKRKNDERIKAELEKINREQIAERRPTITQLWRNILSEHETEYWRAMLWEASPTSFDVESPRNSSRVLQAIYEPSETIWSGGVYDSGKPQHECHFDTAKAFLTTKEIGDRVGCSTFKKESFGRTMDNVQERKIILAESDEMTKSDSACLLHLFDLLKLQVVAVIDTGGKSLHFWIRYSKRALRLLTELVEPLKLDPGALSASHAPLRLPSCVHDITKKPARLFFLNPITQ